MKRFESILFI